MRQIEIGLAALLSVTTGLALDRFQFRDARQHALSLLGGGYRSARWPGDGGNRRRASLFRLFALAMTISMTASSALLIWIILAGILMWRLAPRLGNNADERTFSSHG